MRAVLAILVAMSAVSLGCSSSPVDGKVFKVEKGGFRATITETGELQAVRSSFIVMPWFHWDYGRPKITFLEKEGILVKKGQMVGQLETSGVVRVLGQKEADLAMALADLQMLKANSETKMKQLQADLASTEAALRLAQIDTQRVRFESASAKEISLLQLQKAQKAYQKALEKIEVERKVQDEDLRIQQAKTTQFESEIGNAKRTVERFTLTAPAGGLIEYRTNWRTRTKIRVGDQFWPGQPLMGLPDLRQMRVETTVNETDVSKVRIGQKVIVRLDAFPKIAFEGEVTSVSHICRKKDKDSKLMVFDVNVLLDKSDPILRPGMTVSCELVVADLENVLFVDNLCIQQHGREYFVQVKKGSESRQVRVELGPRNSKSVVVYGDLKKGERLFLPQT